MNNFVHTIQQKLLQNTIKRVVCIEVVMSQSEDITYNIILVERKKSNVCLAHCFTAPDKEELNQWIKPYTHYPCIAVLNTGKILSRVHDITFVDNDEAVLKEVIGSGNKEDFFFQYYAISDHQSLVSVTRKAFLDEAIKEVLAICPELISISIGPWPILFTLPYLNESFHNKNRFSILNYQISVNEGGEISFSTNGSNLLDEIEQKQFLIGNDSIPEAAFIPFGAALQFIANPYERVCVVHGETQKRYKTFAFKKESRTLIFSGLGAVLFLLLISSTIFTVYSEKYQKLLETQQHLSEKNRIDSNREQQQMQAYSLMKKNGLTQPSKISWYADQITSVVPEDMYLNKMEIHPTASSNHPLDGTFDMESINVEGMCYSGQELNEWVNILKSFPWIKRIQIKDYFQESDEELGTFHLDIKKNND